jgi:hypothetical protein
MPAARREADSWKRRFEMERVMVVCDECGSAPAKNHALDLCAACLGTLLRNARAPRRGRPRGAVASTSAKPAAAPKRGGRAKKTERLANELSA